MSISQIRLEQYSCADYLASSWSTSGFWDEKSYLWLLEPLSQVQEFEQRGFLQVGRPGVDGIGFGYRLGHEGFWAYYPMEERFAALALTLADFLEGWRAGTITV
jgi:hypothetical protein